MSEVLDERMQLAADYWSGRDRTKGREYYTFPPLVPYHIEATRGRANLEDYLCTVAGIPVDRMISLCCGFGETERSLARRGAFRECVAYDIAPGAIEAARRRAADAGISGLRYEIRDLNRVEFEADSADVVLANGGLHHIERVEHIVRQIHRALRPGGLFLSGEYVGPDHMQPTPRQHELINAVIHLLPRHLRSSARLPGSAASSRWRFLAGAALMQFRRGRGGDPPPPSTTRMDSVRRVVHTAGAISSRVWSRDAFHFGRVWRYDRRYFKKIDPSEGVRASAIIPTIRASFAEVEVAWMHGTLLAHALDGTFYDNFDPASAADQALLRSLVEYERQAIARGEIGSDHAVILARKH